MKKSLRKFVVLISSFILLLNILPCTSARAAKENKYFLGTLVNAGKDTGYSKKHKIKEDDPHFGWELGEFFISGYSDEEKDSEGNSIFLKNVGDKVTLWFCLNQDINKLNKNKKLSISEDTNGYDEYFGVKKTNFKRGTLIVRKRGADNHWEKPVIYTNYLKANAKKGVYTQVDLFEEGDYEVALNYEIKKTNLSLLGWKPFPSYHNYRIFFKFSIRNGNCMFYLFDAKTKDELTNSAFTQNGFSIDLANSKYLNVNVKKEILNEGKNGLVDDIRFNTPVKDGTVFTEEGIYTISATNEYTQQSTTKKIYVGTNDVLKAHVATGFEIDEINQQMLLGTTVGKNGELIPLSVDNKKSLINPNKNLRTNAQHFVYYLFFAVLGVIVILILLFIVKIKRKQTNKITDEQEEGTEK